MIDINGRKFAKNKVEFANTIFNQGSTAKGFYKIRKRGILFLNLDQKPFLYLCRNNPERPFFVSCSEIEDKGKKKIRYMFSTCSIDEKVVGIESLSYIQKHDICMSIHEVPDESLVSLKKHNQ